MKRLWFIPIALIILLLCWLVFRPYGIKEPTYQGRKLSEWINDYDGPSANTKGAQTREATWKATQHAIKEIGTNAVPTLVDWLQTTNSPRKEKINSILSRQSIISFRFQSAFVIQNKAAFVFDMLGNDALPAVPAVVRLAGSPDPMQRSAAFNVLMIVDRHTKMLLPAFTQLLADSDRNVQMNAAVYICNNYPKDAEKAGVFSLFPHLRPLTASTAGSNGPAVK